MEDNFMVDGMSLALKEVRTLVPLGLSKEETKKIVMRKLKAIEIIEHLRESIDASDEMFNDVAKLKSLCDEFLSGMD